MIHPQQVRSQDFSKGGSQQGHHPGIADYIWFIPLLSFVYQRARLYYRGMKAHISQRQEPLTKILYKKTNFKKVVFSTMAFTAKILSWRFRHSNIVGCFIKRRPTKGGHGHPRTPPSYAPAQRGSNQYRIMDPEIEIEGRGLLQSIQPKLNILVLRGH